MTITCPVCQSPNTTDTEFCTVCGHELQATGSPSPSPAPSSFDPSDIPDLPPIPDFDDLPPFDSTEALPPEPVPIYQTPADPFSAPTKISDPLPQPSTTTSSTAILVAKQPDAPIPKFFLNAEESPLVGRFDPDTGPVEIDLEGFLGEETVSRHHAELYIESGQWKIKDLGSVNGIFIRPAGSRRYGPRITAPTTLQNGDEIAFGKIQFKFQPT
ncbi:MAG: FHA domain-containing protein [Synechococcaceae cyanobacterium SM2_3_2]|nr:FHA domain-containing protein [Synechococcaceae cyanobacterium SM2_3_2]